MIKELQQIDLANQFKMTQYNMYVVSYWIPNFKGTISVSAINVNQALLKVQRKLNLPDNLIYINNIFSEPMV